MRINDIIHKWCKDKEFVQSFTDMIKSDSEMNRKYQEYKKQNNINYIKDNQPNLEIKEDYTKEIVFYHPDEIIERMSGNTSDDLIDYSIRVFKKIARELRVADFNNLIVARVESEYDPVYYDFITDDYKITETRRGQLNSYTINDDITLIREEYDPTNMVFLYFKNTEDADKYFHIIDKEIGYDNELEEDMNNNLYVIKYPSEIKDYFKCVEKVSKDLVNKLGNNYSFDFIFDEESFENNNVSTYEFYNDLVDELKLKYNKEYRLSSTILDHSKEDDFFNYKYTINVLDEDYNNGDNSMKINNIAKKHNVSVDKIKDQVVKGIKVEKEHTDDEKKAERIALDHLFEIPDYYDRLNKMEKGALRENFDLDKNDIDSEIKDSDSNNISFYEFVDYLDSIGNAYHSFEKVSGPKGLGYRYILDKNLTDEQKDYLSSFDNIAIVGDVQHRNAPEIKHSYVIILNEALTEDVDNNLDFDEYDSEDADYYDADHAAEWMERYPYGWYNSESDKGVGDEELDESASDSKLYEIFYKLYGSNKSHSACVSANNVEDALHYFYSLVDDSNKTPIIVDVKESNQLDEMKKNTLKESSMRIDTFDISDKEKLVLDWDKYYGFVVSKLNSDASGDLWRTEFRRTYATEDDAEKAFKRYKMKYSKEVNEELDESFDFFGNAMIMTELPKVGHKANEYGFGYKDSTIFNTEYDSSNDEYNIFKVWCKDNIDDAFEDGYYYRVAIARDSNRR